MIARHETATATAQPGRHWRDHVLTPARRQRLDRSRLVSANRAAAILGVTSRRVLQMAKEGKLQAAVVDDGYCGSLIFARVAVERLARIRQARKTRAVGIGRAHV